MGNIQGIVQMGVYLASPNKDKNIRKSNDKPFPYISAEMQGWRKTMEDAVIHESNIGEGIGLFAVFDGHGGFEVSQYVSKIFVGQLTKLKSFQGKNYQLALDQAFKNIDQLLKSPEGQNQLRIIRYQEQESQETLNEHEKQFIGSAVGCTANVVLITKEHYYIANAGDSRSVLSRKGVAIALSEDHKPQSQTEQTRITKAGGKVMMGRVNGALNLTRSFGDFDYKQNLTLDYSQQMITCKPDIRKVQRKEEDEFIIIGCDGIWQNYVNDNQGMVDIIREWWGKGLDLQKIIQDLMEMLIATDTASGFGCDNMSCILVQLSK